MLSGESKQRVHPDSYTVTVCKYDDVFGSNRPLVCAREGYTLDVKPMWRNMLRDKSDVSWEKWGKQNPYFGVLTDDKFRCENITEESKRELLETGRVHVQRVLSTASTQFGTLARPSALDFGCGVGRLVIPFAREFERVTAVDVSVGMLETARRNCDERDLNNVDFVHSDDRLSQVTRNYDFIHAYLVFQHIPVRRGEAIITELLKRLNDGGVVAIHFPFRCNDSSIRKFTHFLRRSFSPLSVLANVVRGRSWDEPFIQMNCYDVNRVLTLIASYGIKDLFLEVVDAGGFLSAFVFAKKPKHPLPKIEGKHLWAADLSSRK
jgi:SAM-dependent methyltransferase